MKVRVQIAKKLGKNFIKTDDKLAIDILVSLSLKNPMKNRKSIHNKHIMLISNQRKLEHQFWLHQRHQEWNQHLHQNLKNVLHHHHQLLNINVRNKILHRILICHHHQQHVPIDIIKIKPNIVDNQPIIEMKWNPHEYFICQVLLVHIKQRQLHHVFNKDYSIQIMNRIFHPIRIFNGYEEIICLSNQYIVLFYFFWRDIIKMGIQKIVHGHMYHQ